jgi:hypothetical protein
MHPEIYNWFKVLSFKVTKKIRAPAADFEATIGPYSSA